ncbi:MULTISPECIES: hypothetical protein [Bacillus]|uniref:hypothetical protein n=1 Tax=Bacillus TaxID=1386 RepID=UPI0015E0D21C|nr:MULTISPECIES: hypothetical protein [Bacillus]
MNLSAFSFLIYFCFIYLAITMIICTAWVIRDREKLKRKPSEAQEANSRIMNV